MEVKKANFTYAKGRRKTSVATVRLFEGKGVSSINEKPAADLYPSKVDLAIMFAPLKKLDKIEDFYFTAKTAGGGRISQRDAIRHALSRALSKFNPEFKKPLKVEGFLTRDARMVERKHTGFRKARKTEQYSKR